MLQNEEDYEFHFVENPFIRMRERAAQKSLESKSRLGASQLRTEADTEMMDEEEIKK